MATKFDRGWWYINNHCSSKDGESLKDMSIRVVDLTNKFHTFEYVGVEEGRRNRLVAPSEEEENNKNFVEF